jgi:hypothetical protein
MKFIFDCIILCREAAVVCKFSVIMIIRSLSVITPSGEVDYKFRNTGMENKDS